MEIILFIAGFIFAFIGGFLLRDERQFRRTARSCAGKVVGYQVRNSRSGNSSGTQTFAPVISYHFQGQQHQFTAAVSSNRAPYTIGATVPILVSPTDPSQARLNNKIRSILAFVFLLIGLALIVAFFFAFDFSPISVVIAIFVIGSLLVQGGLILRRLKINNIEQMKQRWQQIRKQGFDSNLGKTEQHKIISDPRELNAVKNGGKVTVVVTSLFLIIGLGLCVGGGIFAKKRADFIHTALTGQGTVISFVSRTSHSDGSTSVSYYPVVRYLPSGQSAPITFQHDIGSSHKFFTQGENVNVLYAPDDPHHAIIDQGWLNWLFPIIMIGLGGIFSLTGGSALWKLKRSSARAGDVKKTEPKLEI